MSLGNNPITGFKRDPIGIQPLLLPSFTVIILLFDAKFQLYSLGIMSESTIVINLFEITVPGL